MQFITLDVIVAFDKTGVLKDFNLLHFGQRPHYFTMQVNKCSHTDRLVPMVTRDGQPQATLHGCLVKANIILNATFLCKTLCQLANQITFKKQTCKGKSQLPAMQCEVTCNITLIISVIFLTTVDLSWEVPSERGYSQASVNMKSTKKHLR